MARTSADGVVAFLANSIITFAMPVMSLAAMDC